MPKLKTGTLRVIVATPVLLALTLQSVLYADPVELPAVIEGDLNAGSMGVFGAASAGSSSDLLGGVAVERIGLNDLIIKRSEVHSAAVRAVEVFTGRAANDIHQLGPLSVEKNLESDKIAKSPTAGLLENGPRATGAALLPGLTEARGASEKNFLQAARLEDETNRDGSFVQVAAKLPPLFKNALASSNRSAGNHADASAGNFAPASPAETSRKIRLDNGMEVLIEKKPVLFVDLAVSYPVGGRDDAEGETGSAHFLEHMMFLGTKHVRNWDRIKSAMGGYANGETSQDQTLYTWTIPPQFLELAISLETERMSNPELTDEKIERARRTILEEKAWQQNQAYFTGQQELRRILFSNPRNQRLDVRGSEKDVRAITAKKLRRYFDVYYAPQNAKVVISGDLDLDQTETWVKEYFSSIPMRGSRAPPAPDLREISPKPAGYSEINDPYAAQPAVLFGWKAPAYGTPDYYSAGVLSALLLDRLHKKLVYEQKVALGVSVGLPYLVQEPSAMIGSIVFAPQVTKQDVLAVLDANISAIQRGEFTQEDLEGARSRMNNWAEFQWQNIHNARHLAMAARYGLDGEALREDVARWSQVTMEQVRRTTGHFFAPEKRGVVFVKPDSNPRKSSAASPHRTTPIDEIPTPEEENIMRILEGTEWNEVIFSAPIEYRLSNGLQVVMMPDGTESTVHAKLGFREGSTAWDVSDKKLVNLVAQLIAYRTKKYSQPDIAKLLGSMQAGLEMDEMWGHSVLNGNMAPDRAIPLLSLISEMVTRPYDWSEEELAPLKSWWKEKLKGARTDPGYVSHGQARQDLLGNHPAANGNLTVEAIDSLTPKEIARIIRTHFAPDNAVLVIAGDVDPESLRPQLESLFGSWQPSGRIRQNPVPVEIKPQNFISLMDRPGSEQTRVQLTGIGIGSGKQISSDFFPLVVANHILGSDSGSRLYQILRQSLGYVYTPFSAVMTDPAIATWTFGIDTRPANLRPAFRALLEQAHRMRAEPPTSFELASAKNNVIFSFLMSLDEIGRIANHLLGLGLFDVPFGYMGDYIRKVSEVTGEAVRQVAGKILKPEGVAITVVGDAQTSLPQLSDVRPIRVYDRNGTRREADPAVLSGGNWLSRLIK